MPSGAHGPSPDPGHRLASGHDAIVVGCGIEGAAVAFRLARQSRRVLCIDSGSPGSATDAAGAMLGVLGELTEHPRGPAKLDLLARIEASRLYPGWLEEIRQIGGAAPRLGTGTFVVGNAARAADATAIAAMEAVAATHALACERVTADNVPGFAPAPHVEIGAIIALEQECSVNSRELLRDLRQAGTATGCVSFVTQRVTEVLTRASRACGVRTAEGMVLEADAIVLAAGTGLREIIDGSPALAGLLPPILGGKGTSIVLAPPVPHLRGQLITHPIRTPNRDFACGLHVVPREDHVYVGATNRVSRHRGVTGAVTVDEVRVLLGTVSDELSSDLGAWDIVALQHGERPLTADGRPLAGPCELDGLLLATAAYRNGVLLAPLIADIVAGGGGAPDELEAWFAPARRAQQRATQAQAARVLEAGLVELRNLIADPHSPMWTDELEPLLSSLSTTLVDRGSHSAGREQAMMLLQKYPLVAMVPEAVVEFAQAASGVDRG